MEAIGDVTAYAVCKTDFNYFAKCSEANMHLILHRNLITLFFNVLCSIIIINKKINIIFYGAIILLELFYSNGLHFIVLKK